MSTKPQRMNPPWTIEEKPGGKWSFTHPSGKFELIQLSSCCATFFGGGKRGSVSKMHTISLEYVFGPCHALAQIMAFLEGWREEWGRQNNRKPLWREKR